MADEEVDHLEKKNKIFFHFFSHFFFFLSISVHLLLQKHPVDKKASTASEELSPAKKKSLGFFFKNKDKEEKHYPSNGAGSSGSLDRKSMEIRTHKTSSSRDSNEYTTSLERKKSMDVRSPFS